MSTATEPRLADSLPATARRLGCAVFLAAMLLPGGGTRAGIPGTGALIDAISDEFESPWTFDYGQNISSNGFWYGSFRGAPEVLQLVAPPGGALPGTGVVALRLRSVDTEDSFPGLEDLVSDFYVNTVFGRFVYRAESPSFVTWAWFPPVSEWPEAAHTFGFRVAARDQTLVDPEFNPSGEYYPSLWAYRHTDGQGYLLARVGDGFVPDMIVAQVDPGGGWHTLGLSWDENGTTEYYARSGRSPLTAGHLIYTDTVSGRTMDFVAYHFYSIRFPATGALSPDFLADRCQVFTQALPAVPTLRGLTRSAGVFSMSIEDATPGFLYRVEMSATLAPGSWLEAGRFLADGQPQPFADPTPAGAMFYRVTR